MTRTSARHLARLFFAIAGASSAACSDSVEVHIDTKPFTESVCQGGVFPHPTLDLRPKTAVDLIELRSDPGFGGAMRVVVVSSNGEACKTATTKSTCFADFATAESSEKFYIEPGYDIASRYWLVTTRGDEVRSYGTAADVLALLAPIDTADEAVLAMAIQLPAHRIDCTVGNVHTSKDGGYDVLTQTGSGCGDDVVQHVVHVNVDGSATITASDVIRVGDRNCAIGRRPAGLVTDRAKVGAGLGALFARIATLEAASVPAFERLESELRALGAPSSLLAGCRRARRDEIRHARVMTELARAHGAQPESPIVEQVAERTIEAIAIENAIEGCVRETHGALVATHQAMHATDRFIARIMRGIARDETRHAALSWTIDAWLRTKLDADAIERIDLARAKALHDLEREIEANSSFDAEHARAGFPSPGVARAMLASLSIEVVGHRGGVVESRAA